LPSTPAANHTLVRINDRHLRSISGLRKLLTYLWRRQTAFRVTSDPVPPSWNGNERTDRLVNTSLPDYSRYLCTGPSFVIIAAIALPPSITLRAKADHAVAPAFWPPPPHFNRGYLRLAALKTMRANVVLRQIGQQWPRPLRIAAMTPGRSGQNVYVRPTW